MATLLRGVVGLDIGPPAVDTVSTEDAILEYLYPEVEEPGREFWRLQRALVRARWQAPRVTAGPALRTHRAGRCRVAVRPEKFEPTSSHLCGRN